MPKTTTTYWNVLAAENSDRWKIVEGVIGIAQITLAIDPVTGDYTRITRFQAGTDTTILGAQAHDYPEEILIISGRLYDEAFSMWLETGYYASRPPGEVHGPFRAATECLVLECSYPSQACRDVS
jgi:hypothetical protein